MNCQTGKKLYNYVISLNRNKFEVFFQMILAQRRRYKNGQSDQKIAAAMFATACPRKQPIQHPRLHQNWIWRYCSDTKIARKWKISQPKNQLL